MKFNQKMKDRALSFIILYWDKPRKGFDSQKLYSLDSETDRKKGNVDPGIDRLYRCFVKRELGNFKIALVFDNKTKHCIRVWNGYGEEESPEKYNRI